MKYLQIAMVSLGLSAASVSGATAASVNVPITCTDINLPCDLGPLDTSSQLQISFETTNPIGVSVWKATVPLGWQLTNIKLDFTLSSGASQIIGSIDGPIVDANWVVSTVETGFQISLDDLSSGETFALYASSPTGTSGAFAIIADWSQEPVPVPAVPLPAGGLLLLTGLAGLGAARRKKRP